MKKITPKNLTVSIHDRLLNAARITGRPFNELLQYYAIERFLYRLSTSQYADKFVLKGALLFRAWGLSAFRPTRDIDLLGQMSNQVENLIMIAKNICAQEVQEDDGIRFDLDSVVGERIKEDADYEGVRLRFIGWLGKARVNLQIDVGFADIVSPAPVPMKYPVILPMPAPELDSYPPETVVAEKLQAMVYLGSINSRMKDFYDLWVLSRCFKFEGKNLLEAIHQTFEHRKTAIPVVEPEAFSARFAMEKQGQWTAFIKKNAINDAPSQLESLLKLLQQFISPIFLALREGKEFNRIWATRGKWL